MVFIFIIYGLLSILSLNWIDYSLSLLCLQRCLIMKLFGNSYLCLWRSLSRLLLNRLYRRRLVPLRTRLLLFRLWLLLYHSLSTLDVPLDSVLLFVFVLRYVDFLLWWLGCRILWCLSDDLLSSTGLVSYFLWSQSYWRVSEVSCVGTSWALVIDKGLKVIRLRRIIGWWGGSGSNDISHYIIHTVYTWLQEYLSLKELLVALDFLKLPLNLMTVDFHSAYRRLALNSMRFNLRGSRIDDATQTSLVLNVNTLLSLSSNWKWLQRKSSSLLSLSLTTEISLWGVNFHTTDHAVWVADYIGELRNRSGWDNENDWMTKKRCLLSEMLPVSNPMREGFPT